MKQDILSSLWALQDEGYRTFQCKLMPTVSPDTVIGVRMPALRKLAREVKDTAQAHAFLSRLPHQYYEENNLHGLLLCTMNDYGETVAALNHFLPYVNNWATCDLLAPRAFRQPPRELLPQVAQWLQSPHTYTVRFALGVLLRNFLDEHFSPACLALAQGVSHPDYYVRMMQAWYFAEALIKQESSTLPLLTERSLPPWIHNKTIQKAVESRRLSPSQKEFLKSLRWKDKNP